MARDEAKLARAARKGPLITLTCECGERQDLHYGEQWRCEKCGRTWNTNRIPLEQYAEIQRKQVRLRRTMLSLIAVALISIAVFILIGKVVGGIMLVAVCALGWRQYIWPRQKQRYVESIDKLPSWEIEPD
jgi:hypothetical protein